MILMPDLFSFAYVPNWYSQLDMLAEMALPEPWRFKNPIYLTKNPDTPILERYIHAIFKKQLIDYKDERNPSSAADYFHIENEFCCFHTGLYTRRYKAIYACFDRNKKKDSLLEWYFRGFADELSPMLRHISPLPKKPSYSVFDEAGKVVYAGSAAASTYTVQKGDSLWAIAEKRLGNGTRYNEIKKLNGLTSDVIYSGQVLKLPNR